MVLKAFRSLHFAVRLPVLAAYLGQLFAAVAVLTVVPAAVSAMSGREDIALRYVVLIVAFGAVGALGMRQRGVHTLQANEALVVSALIFVIVGLAMAFPLTGYGIEPVDAIFEAISGVTTTGLSTLPSLDGHPPAFFFARAWLQWVGGLGIVVLALAFVVPAGVSAARLGFDDRETGGLATSTRAHAHRIVTVYVVLTTLGIGAGVLVGMAWFDAIVLVFAAVSTGGFAPTDASLGALSIAGRAVVSGACLLGAVSFARYATGSGWTCLRSVQLWTGVGMIGMVVATIGALTGSWGDALWMAISAQTTAGFSTLPASDLPAAAKLALVASMFVGGEVGSTAGGVKIFRVVVLLQLVLARLMRVSMPTGSHIDQRIEGTRVSSDEVADASALALAYLAVVGLVWFAFLVDGAAPLNALFDVVSAGATVGLSTGVVGPHTEPWLKGLVCVLMVMGRVEILAIAVVCFPGTWIGRRRRT